jgi:hypothetical protein
MAALRRSMLLVAAALAGCSTLTYNTQWDPGAPYATYTTYAWLSTVPGAEQAAAIRDPAARALVVSAVDREMARRGFVELPPDKNPNFFVYVIGWGKDRVDVTTYGYTYMGAYDKRPMLDRLEETYGPWGPTPVTTPVIEVNQYKEGTLVIDFVDANTKKLFWRGTASDTVTSPAHLKGVIDEAVRKLIDAYPPKM